MEIITADKNGAYGDSSLLVLESLMRDIADYVLVQALKKLFDRTHMSDLSFLCQSNEDDPLAADFY
jgi:hypothetical protein